MYPYIYFLHGIASCYMEVNYDEMYSNISVLIVLPTAPSKKWRFIHTFE